jgi:hypothetical protein
MNYGRTAPVSAESSVSSQRIISICLLVFYGLPAGIGPGWHRHDDACTHLSTTASQQKEDGEQVRKERCCCQCSCQSTELEIDENPPQAVSLVGPQIVFQHDHGPCLICDFYSQAKNCTCGDLQVVSGLLVTLWPSPALQVVAIEPVSGKARGPPRRA